jgi:hypothetical protein
MSKVVFLLVAIKMNFVAGPTPALRRCGKTRCDISLQYAGRVIR